MSKKQEEIKVMEDHGPWIFTEDQIYKIKMQNKIAIRKFFEDNSNLIHSVAGKFVYKRKCLYGFYNYSVEELVNQFYVDLPYYHFDSRCRFFCDIIKGSFLKIGVGGIQAKLDTYKSNLNNRMYDAPLNEYDEQKNTSYVLDTIKSTQTLEETYFADNEEEREEKDKKIMEYLEKTMPNKKDLNKMFCQLFTDIPICEIQGDEYEQYIQRKSEISERQR